MADLNPYLTFNGNCREAMKFYESCMGGEMQMMTFADTPGHDSPPEMKDKIMHASLKKGNFVLMASDAMPGQPVQQGNNVHLSVNCGTIEELERLFPAFAKQGKITMPLQDVFWGARFGMLIDQFGISWMFNCEKK